MASGQKKRRLKQVGERRAPRRDQQVRCGDCGRFHLRGEACWFCTPPAPEHCACDINGLPIGHQHLRHHLLERWFQLLVEGIDESILQPAGEEDPRQLYQRQDAAGHWVTVEQPARWQEAEDLKPWLDRYGVMRGLANGPDGTAGIFRWLGARDVDAEAYEMAAAGFTELAVAEKLAVKVEVVRQRIENVESLIGHALWFLDHPKGVA